MNPIRKAYRRVVAGLKNAALSWGNYGSRWYWNGRLAGSSVNYAAAVGDGSGNAAVIACVGWLRRTFLEAPLRARRIGRDGKLTPEPLHPMIRLINRPNPHWTGRALWRATVTDRKIDGNAYWYKVRSRGNRPVELWWLPAIYTCPKRRSGSDAFVTHYEYTVNGRTQEFPPSDIIHFRGEPDPTDPMRGQSDLAPLLREIFTDDEAGNYTAALLKNMGVAGPIIRPKTPEDILTREQAEAIKAQFQANYGGDNRGMAMVALTPLDIDHIGFNPRDMQLAELRRVPEERIAAVLGVPPILAGLGAGLQRSTYSNYAEAREAGFEGSIIPLQGDFAADLMLQLLPDFGDDDSTVTIDFDISDVRVLQEDATSLATRMETLVRSTVLTIDEAREEIGYEPLPGGVGNALLVAAQMTVTPVADIGAPPAPAPAPASTPLPDGGTDAQNVTELRRVAGVIEAEYKRLGLPAGNGNGHREPAPVVKG